MSQVDQDTQQDSTDGSTSVPADNKRVMRKRGVAKDSVIDGDSKPKDDTKKKASNGKPIKSEDEKPKTKKRGADEDPTENGSKKKTKDIQKTAAKTLIVPIDEGFIETGKLNSKSATQDSPGVKILMSFIAGPEVYIDDAGLIWDATLSQTVSSSNANKFYRVQLLVGANSKYLTWTRWGRVGERGQSACLGDGSLQNAMVWYEKKFKDKSGLRWEDRLEAPRNNKYTFLERNYDEDDEDSEKDEKPVQKGEDGKPPPESALSKGIQNLMSFIFNINNVLETLAALSYDAKKLPLGKLGERTLKSGFLVLKEISEIMATPALAQERYGTAASTTIENLSDRYYSLIPHVFGRNRPPVLNTNQLIKREIDLLEALTDMDVANEIMQESKEDDELNELDRQFQSLGMEEMTEREYQPPRSVLPIPTNHV